MQDRVNSIIAVLKVINHRIREKIPVVANRYEEVETYSPALSLEEAKERYDKHDHMVWLEGLKFRYYKVINKWFVEYCNQHNTREEKILTPSVIEIKENLLIFLRQEFSKYQKLNEFYESTRDADLEEVEDYFNTHIDTVHAIRVKLYDFGEMALTPPTDDERQQLAHVIKSSLSIIRFFNKDSFATSFEKSLSDRIDMLTKRGQSANYLMHVRKGMLALQDFYQFISKNRMKQILHSVFLSEEIHPVFIENLRHTFTVISRFESCCLFKSSRTEMLDKNIKLLSHTTQHVGEKSLNNLVLTKKMN